MSIGWASFTAILFFALVCFVMAVREARMRG
jgi:hypothetical protein